MIRSVGQKTNHKLSGAKKFYSPLSHESMLEFGAFRSGAPYEWMPEVLDSTNAYSDAWNTSNGVLEFFTNGSTDGGTAIVKNLSITSSTFVVTLDYKLFQQDVNMFKLWANFTTDTPFAPDYGTNHYLDVGVDVWWQTLQDKRLVGAYSLTDTGSNNFFKPDSTDPRIFGGGYWDTTSIYNDLGWNTIGFSFDRGTLNPYFNGVFGPEWHGTSGHMPDMPGTSGNNTQVAIDLFSQDFDRIHFRNVRLWQDIKEVPGVASYG